MVADNHISAGVPRQGIFLTEDWEKRDWLVHRNARSHDELFDDFNVPRYGYRAIQNERDREKFRFLLYPLSDGAVAEVRATNAGRARQAEKLGVLLVAQWSCRTDAAVWICGVSSLLDLAFDGTAAIIGVLNEPIILE